MDYSRSVTGTRILTAFFISVSLYCSGARRKLNVLLSVFQTLEESVLQHMYRGFYRHNFHSMLATQKQTLCKLILR